jgi:hypothetical protein
MSMEEIKYTLMKGEAERLLRHISEGANLVEQLRAEVKRLSYRLRVRDARIEALEQALFEYGEHKVTCHHGDVHPDAHCDCGLEDAINGP